MNGKGKKLLLATLLGGVLAVGGLAACSDGDSKDLQTGGGGEVVQPVSSVTLNKETLTMEKYSTDKTLSATLENLQGSVVWTSSDENVLAVNGNVLIAKSVGTATVTAKVGEYADTCVVTVVEGDGVLEFSDLENMSLSQGAEYALDGTLLYEGVAFPFVTVTYEAESDKDLLTVTQDGKIVVHPESVGYAKYYGDGDV